MFLRRAPAIAASAALLALAGCGGPARTTTGGAPAPATGTSSPSAPATDPIVLEVRLRRGAELSDTRGALRLLDQDLGVEYRVGGRGPGLDAGELTLDGHPMHRQVSGKGSVSYRLGREEPEGGVMAGGNPWATIANSGGERVAAASAQVKLAPFPVVTQPSPEQTVLRSDELPVVMLPPVPDLWYRVTLVGAGDPVTATDFGQGRWLFPRGSLERLTSGRAKVLVEVEASCGDCPGAGVMRVNTSSHTELEIAITLL